MWENQPNFAKKLSTTLDGNLFNDIEDSSKLNQSVSDLLFWVSFWCDSISSIDPSQSVSKLSQMFTKPHLTPSQD